MCSFVQNGGANWLPRLASFCYPGVMDYKLREVLADNWELIRRSREMQDRAAGARSASRRLIDQSKALITGTRSRLILDFGSRRPEPS